MSSEQRDRLTTCTINMSFDPVLPPFDANDPQASFLGLSSLDLLLIELVPLAYRLADEQSNSVEKLDEDNERQLAFYKLESLGYRVGLGLAERFVLYFRLCLA
jgi:hypothetical protein